ICLPRPQWTCTRLLGDALEALSGLRRGDHVREAWDQFSPIRLIQMIAKGTVQIEIIGNQRTKDNSAETSKRWTVSPRKIRNPAENCPAWRCRDVLPAAQIIERSTMDPCDCSLKNSMHAEYHTTH